MEDKIKKEFSEGKELSNEALEGVSGGSTYSDLSYDELSIKCNSTRQVGSNHPLIVTLFNSCDLYSCSCATCDWAVGGIPMYCQSRSRENDPCKVATALKQEL